MTMTFDIDAFGARVLGVRQERNLTLRDAAAQVGVSFNTLYRAENGYPNMQINNVIRIAAWAGLSLDEYIT